MEKVQALGRLAAARPHASTLACSLAGSCGGRFWHQRLAVDAAECADNIVHRDLQEAGVVGAAVRVAGSS